MIRTLRRREQGATSQSENVCRDAPPFQQEDAGQFSRASEAAKNRKTLQLVCQVSQGDSSPKTSTPVFITASRWLNPIFTDMLTLGVRSGFSSLRLMNHWRRELG
jgi:hypothetical protein